MRGLLEQGMTQPPVSKPPVATEAAAVPGTASGATPAPGVDQKEVDIFVANGMKLIHDPKVSDTIIDRVVNSKTPAAAVADATLSIVSRLEESSKAAGKKPSLTTLAYGANVLMGEIITSAEAAGMEKMDEKTRYHAFSLAVGKYLEEAVKTGKMTEEEVLQLGKDAEATPEGQKINQYLDNPEMQGGPNGTT